MKRGLTLRRGVRAFCDGGHNGQSPLGEAAHIQPPSIPRNLAATQRGGVDDAAFDFARRGDRLDGECARGPGRLLRLLDRRSPVPCRRTAQLQVQCLCFDRRSQPSDDGRCPHGPAGCARTARAGAAAGRSDHPCQASASNCRRCATGAAGSRPCRNDFAARYGSAGAETRGAEDCCDRTATYRAAGRRAKDGHHANFTDRTAQRQRAGLFAARRMGEHRCQGHRSHRTLRICALRFRAQRSLRPRRERARQHEAEDARRLDWQHLQPLQRQYLLRQDDVDVFRQAPCRGLCDRPLLVYRQRLDAGRGAAGAVGHDLAPMEWSAVIAPRRPWRDLVDRRC